MPGDVPELIKIINENQLRHDSKPDAPKKSLADHLRNKVMMRFVQENKGVKSPKKRRQIEERRKRIEKEVNDKMAIEFMKPSRDYTSKLLRV